MKQDLNIFKNALLIFIGLELILLLLMVFNIVSYQWIISLALGFIVGAITYYSLIISIDSVLDSRMRKAKSFAFFGGSLRMAMYGAVFYVSYQSPILNIWIVLIGILVTKIAIYSDYFIRKEGDA